MKAIKVLSIAIGSIILICTASLFLTNRTTSYDVETYAPNRVHDSRLIPQSNEIITRSSSTNSSSNAKLIFSSIFTVAALWVVLSKKYDDETKKWAFSVLTLIAGVWIGSL